MASRLPSRSRTHRIDRRPNWRPSSRLLLGDWSRTAQPVLRQGCTRTPRPEAVACPHAADTYEAERDRRRNPIRAREGLCDQRRRVGGGTPLTGGPRGWIDRRDHCRGERQCIICTGSGDRFEQAFFSNPAIVRQDACRDGERSKLISLVTMLAVVGDRMALAIDRLHPVPTNPLAFAVLAYDFGFQRLGHGVPFLQLSEVADDGQAATPASFMDPWVPESLSRS